MSHRFSLLQYRMQIAAMLLMLIVVIVVNGYVTKRHMDRMNTAVTAMYEDRLLASSYIFDLAGYMYELKMGLAAPQNGVAYPKPAINSLIDKYDHTVLTTQEAIVWAAFKEDLKAMKKLLRIRNTQHQQ